jgi:hypothetical protein
VSGLEWVAAPPGNCGGDDVACTLKLGMSTAGSLLMYASTLCGTTSVMSSSIAFSGIRGAGAPCPGAVPLSRLSGIADPQISATPPADI